MGFGVLVGFSNRVQRVGLQCSLAALACVLGVGLKPAAAENDTRTISMHHLHTGENLTITYKRNGRYDEEALKKLNWLLRDWRAGRDTKMDPRLIDTLWDVSRELNVRGPIQIVCGYRSPGTNAMLRRRAEAADRRHAGRPAERPADRSRSPCRACAG